MWTAFAGLRSSVGDMDIERQALNLIAAGSSPAGGVCAVCAVQVAPCADRRSAHRRMRSDSVGSTAHLTDTLVLYHTPAHPVWSDLNHHTIHDVGPPSFVQRLLGGARLFSLQRPGLIPVRSHQVDPILNIRSVSAIRFIRHHRTPHQRSRFRTDCFRVSFHFL